MNETPLLLIQMQMGHLLRGWNVALALRRLLTPVGSLGFALSMCISSTSLPALLFSAMRHGEIDCVSMLPAFFSPLELSKEGTALSSTRFLSFPGWIKPRCSLAARPLSLCVEAEPARWVVCGRNSPQGVVGSTLVVCRALGEASES